MLSPVALFGPYFMALLLRDRPAVLLGLGVLVVSAVTARLLGPSARVQVVLLAAATAGTTASLAVALAGPVLARVGLPQRTTSLAGAQSHIDRLMVYLVAALVLTLLVLLVAALLRPVHRRALVFLVGLAAWAGLTVVPSNLGREGAATPLAYDVLLTAAVAGAGALWWAGRQSSVTPQELVLLLVICTAVVEVPWRSRWCGTRCRRRGWCWAS